jgi:ligand-binding SRPBCC domain-containing protein
VRLFRIQRTHRLPISVAAAWDFFSNPTNLADITPPLLRLRVVSEPPERIYEGMIISYRLRIFAIGVSWVTEITTVQEPILFVDEQRFGPYKFWHHQHRFRAVDGGVEVTDLINYGMPFGPFGRIAQGLFVGRDLERIFDFRKKALEDRFGVIS